MRVLPLLVPFLLLAGCSDAPAPEPTEPLDAAPPAPEAPPQSRTLHHFAETVWEGRTKEGFFVCANQDGTGSCPAGQQVQPDGEHATTVSYNGTFSEALVRLEWTPADPSQTGLVLVAFGPDGLLDIARGGGELNLAVGPESGLPPDGSITLAVWPEGKTPTEPSLFVDATRQPFRVVVDVLTTTVEAVPAVPDAES